MNHTDVDPEMQELMDSSVTMYSRLAQAELDIDSLDLQFADTQTRFNAIDGRFSNVDTTLASYSASINGLSADISNVSQIRQKADERIDFKRSHQYVIVSVGHVSKVKGSDIALNVAEKLKETGVDFEWLFIGEVHNDYNYEEFINENHLSGHVKMLGPINNPYPYVKEADIFVQLSRFEGKSLSLDEAKILEKPIVVTNFSSVNDQFSNGVNASICQMDTDDAYLKISELLENEALRQKYITSLEKTVVDNSSEVEKIYKLID